MRLLSVALLAILFQQCSYSQSSKNTAKMDTDKTNNPVYSRTDSASVNLSEEEWKKSMSTGPSFKKAGIAVSFPLPRGEFLRLYPQAYPPK